MIKVGIVAKKNRIYTDVDEKDVVLGDVALMIRELEKIKLELLGKDFDMDYDVKVDGEEE